MIYMRVPKRNRNNTIIISIEASLGPKKWMFQRDDLFTFWGVKAPNFRTQFLFRQNCRSSIIFGIFGEKLT